MNHCSMIKPVARREPRGQSADAPVDEAEEEDAEPKAGEEVGHVAHNAVDVAVIAVAHPF